MKNGVRDIYIYIYIYSFEGRGGFFAVFLLFYGTTVAWDSWVDVCCSLLPSYYNDTEYTSTLGILVRGVATVVALPPCSREGHGTIIRRFSRVFIWRAVRMCFFCWESV